LGTRAAAVSAEGAGDTVRRWVGEDEAVAAAGEDEAVAAAGEDEAVAAVAV